MSLLDVTAVIGIVSTLIFGIIAIIYYFRVKNLMTAVDVTKWSEISDHYAQIKFLKLAGWKM